MSSESTEYKRGVLFATAVLAAFDQAGLGSDTEIATAGGPSSTTMTKLRKAAQGEILLPEPRNDTFRRIERAAAWMPGSARSLWREGRDPVPGPKGIVLEGKGTLAPTGRTRADRVTVGGLDNYLESLEARITELEERLDLIDPALVERRNRAVHPVPAAKAARKGPSAGRARRAAQDTAAELD